MHIINNISVNTKYPLVAMEYIIDSGLHPLRYCNRRTRLNYYSVRYIVWSFVSLTYIHNLILNTYPFSSNIIRERKMTLKMTYIIFLYSLAPIINS